MRASAVLEPTTANFHEEDHKRGIDFDSISEHAHIFETQPAHVTPEPFEQSEQQLLIRRILQGDSEAFNEIVHQYSTLMLHTACMIVGDRDIAEDAVQDALIQAWQHLSSLRETGSLRPWLLRIVINQSISFKRRLARSTAFIRQSLAEQLADAAAQLADDYNGRTEYRWDLTQAIANLPVKQRAVIVLHYYDGLTLPEMAQTLQTSENTLKKRIQTALVNLRRVLRGTDADQPSYTRQGSYVLPISVASGVA